MRLHRIIIGSLFASIALLLVVFVMFTWKKVFSVETATHAQEVSQYTVIVAAAFAVASLTMLLNYRHAAWYCVPFSVALLAYLPVGTIIGGYYLWYFWRFIYKRDTSRK